MNKRNLTLGLLGAAVLGAGAYGASAMAFQGRVGSFGPNYTPERHEQMQKAFESNDYATWKVQMADRGATRFVNEQNFSRFSEMHKLMLEGEIEDAAKIRQELGMGQGRGMGGSRGAANRGQNRGGNFVDANGDGICDLMQ